MFKCTTTYWFKTIKQTLLTIKTSKWTTFKLHFWNSGKNPWRTWLQNTSWMRIKYTWMLFFPAPADIDKPLLAVCVKLEEHKYKSIRQLLHLVLAYCTNQGTTEKHQCGWIMNTRDHRMTQRWWNSNSLTANVLSAWDSQRVYSKQSLNNTCFSFGIVEHTNYISHDPVELSDGNTTQHAWNLSSPHQTSERPTWTKRIHVFI